MAGQLVGGFVLGWPASGWVLQMVLQVGALFLVVVLQLVALLYLAVLDCEGLFPLQSQVILLVIWDGNGQLGVG